MESRLRLCRACGRLATLFRINILSTPTSASCHGRLPAGGVQKTQLRVTGRPQALPFRTAQIGGSVRLVLDDD